MQDRTRNAIAERIRILIKDAGESIEQTAARLGVDELALRISVDTLAPYPTIDVITAIVREYAVDPSWLLTGRYDEYTHRRALEAKATELPMAISAMMAGRREQPPRLKLVD